MIFLWYWSADVLPLADTFRLLILEILCGNKHPQSAEYDNGCDPHNSINQYSERFVIDLHYIRPLLMSKLG
jgi:hypothetical protein